MQNINPMVVEQTINHWYYYGAISILSTTNLDSCVPGNIQAAKLAGFRVVGLREGGERGGEGLSFHPISVLRCYRLRARGQGDNLAFVGKLWVWQHCTSCQIGICSPSPPSSLDIGDWYPAQLLYHSHLLWYCYRLHWLLWLWVAEQLVTSGTI